jgi:hypothetical protein
MYKFDGQRPEVDTTTPYERLMRFARGDIQAAESEPNQSAWASFDQTIEAATEAAKQDCATADEVRRMIQLALVGRDHEIDGLKADIAALREENAGFRRKLGMYAMLEYGQIPQVSDPTKIGCQIFYSPWLTAEERRTKSIWSLRLSISILHHRVMEEINVRLFPFQQFAKMARKPQYQTDVCDTLLNYIDKNGFADEVWAGFVQSFTDGGGRPYVKEQVTVLRGHEMDISPNATQAQVSMLIGSEGLAFGVPRPATGKSDTSALWYCAWKPAAKAK